MTFIEACKAFGRSSAPRCVIQRENGPSFSVDDSGLMRLANDCLYVGDILEFEDWTFTEESEG